MTRYCGNQGRGDYNFKNRVLEVSEVITRNDVVETGSCHFPQRGRSGGRFPVKHTKQSNISGNYGFNSMQGRRQKDQNEVRMGKHNQSFKLTNAHVQ